MNNYVSKEVAKKLKEAEFREKTKFYYRIDSDPNNKDILRSSNNCEDWNHGPWYAVPDFLMAADWLWEKHGIQIVFNYGYTVAARREFSAIEFPDHRNQSILFALNQIQIKK